MPKIDLKYVTGILQATKSEDLHEHLQAAIELEHSTVPPYLSALYSIKPDCNQAAYQIIFSVVVEEMLHLVIAANVLNAIGGKPELNRPNFIPTYPGTLPMNVGDGLVVGLAPLSKKVLHDTFMEIEKPEDPQEFPVQSFKSLLVEQEPEYATIGQFYEAIIDKIKELGEACFTGDPSRQVTNEQWFPKKELFAVTDVNTAVKALTLIVKQGEGTSNSPLDPEGNYAHYYRFAEIYHGKRLKKDTSAPHGYSYSGVPIPLDPDGIWDLKENSKAEDYKEGTAHRRMVDQFNFSYTNLLNALHDTLNGKPNNLNVAMGLMYQLKLQAQQMVELTDPISGKQVAPAFEYAPVNVSA